MWSRCARARAGARRTLRQRAGTEEQRAGRVGRTRRPRDGRAQEDFRGRSRSRAVSRVFTLENVAVARYADVGARRLRDRRRVARSSSRLTALSPDRRARRRKRSKLAFARGTNQSFEIWRRTRRLYARGANPSTRDSRGTDSPSWTPPAARDARALVSTLRSRIESLEDREHEHRKFSGERVAIGTTTRSSVLAELRDGRALARG